MNKPLFGPGGNSESFYAEGFKSTLQAPGLDCRTWPRCI